MDTPTPLQRQIEETVTNCRGYAPQITPIDLATSLQFPKSLYIQNVYAFLERQRLQVTLQSMEAQQSSPTLGDSFIRYLEKILTDSPRPGSDIKPIKLNYFPLKEKLLKKQGKQSNPFSPSPVIRNENSPSDWERLQRLHLAGVIDPLIPSATDSSSFPWDSEKSRSFREYIDLLRARQQDPFNPSTPFDDKLRKDPFSDRPDPHAFDHLISLEPRPQLPLKKREFLTPDPLPQHKEFPYKEEPRPLNRYITLEPKKNFQRPPETAPQQRDPFDLLKFLPPKPNSNPTQEQSFLDEILRKLGRERDELD